MKYDEDKVNELTLVLLYLASHGRKEGCGGAAFFRLEVKTIQI